MPHGLLTPTTNNMVNKLKLVISLEPLLLHVEVEEDHHPLLEEMVEDVLVPLKMVPTTKPFNKVLIGSVVKPTVNQSTLEEPTSNQTHSKHMPHGLSMLITNNMANKLKLVISLELLPRPVVVVEDQPHPLLLLLLKAVLVLLKVELMLKPFNKDLTGSVDK